MKTLPNALTGFRLVLIPFFAVAFYLPFSWAYFAAALIFVVAAVTDYFDGYLARKLEQTTPFGAFLDPVADKVMVVTALIMLVDHYHGIWLTIPALIMIGREIIISALREWMAELGKRSSVAVSSLGKYKTTAQMLSIVALLWQDQPWMIQVGMAALYVATLLTIWSMVSYLRAAWPTLKGQ
jgi:CDP-diacylglycerol--glycerol-3-phosphate 3-phosphatidyltransferase